MQLLIRELLIKLKNQPLREVSKQTVHNFVMDNIMSMNKEFTDDEISSLVDSVLDSIT